MTALLHDRLIEALNYNRETGVFTWKIKSSKNTVIGSVAGSWKTESKERPIRIRLDGKSYRAHRLAWFYEKKVFPSFLIDHINGNCHDNRMCNLREATQSLNQQNQRRSHSDNKTGFLGVAKVKNGYRASIYANGKSNYLGLFSTPECAHVAYVQAKRDIHEGNTL